MGVLQGALRIEVQDFVLQPCGHCFPGLELCWWLGLVFVAGLTKTLVLSIFGPLCFDVLVAFYKDLLETKHRTKRVLEQNTRLGQPRFVVVCEACGAMEQLRQRNTLGALSRTFFFCFLCFFAERVVCSYDKQDTLGCPFG